MEIKILGQGYEAISKDAVGYNLIELFSKSDFHTFFGISAFSSQSGINGLTKHIEEAKKHLRTITIITGVNLQGTSKEALIALLNLNINAFVFYTGPYPIFHPKIYLFEGREKSVLIIGSSNLTKPGLFTNIEVSLLIKINNKLKEDREIVIKLKDYFIGLFNYTDPNLKSITVELINEFVREGIVPTEAQQKALRIKVGEKVNEHTNSVISKIFPKRVIAKVPHEFMSNPNKMEQSPKPLSITGNESKRGKLSWRRKKLPGSSVQISAEGTNPTGGLRLVQDDFFVDGERIKQTTYFRHVLFGKYNWKKIRNTPLVEATTAPFEITIKDKYIGKFDLEVRHKPSGEAGQHNYTTSISWGQVGNIIREANLVGRSLDIFSPSGKGKPFHIVIS